MKTNGYYIQCSFNYSEQCIMFRNFKERVHVLMNLRGHYAEPLPS